MSNKQVLQEKITKAQAQMTKFKTQGEISVPVFTKWLHETSRFDFNTELINISETLLEKLQFLLHGKPYIIEHEESPEDLGNFVEQIMLQEVMFANEKLLFTEGASYVIIEKIGTEKNPRIQLRLAEPQFPNTVVRLGNVKIRSEIWSTFVYNRVNYYIMTTTTPTEILTDVYTFSGADMSAIASQGEKQDLEEFNKLLPKSMQIKGKAPNPYGFIPIVEVQYKPTMDFSWRGRDEIAPFARIEGKQKILNETTKIMLTEQYVNRTKMLADKDLLATADREDLAKLADENIIGVLKDSGNVDGENKVIEFVQGDPKLDQYWNSIKNIISLAVADLKLSELSEEQTSGSATGEIFNKGNDVETGNTLQIFRQKAITEILQKAWSMYKNESFEEYEIDLSKWNVQLIPNVIMNEAKMTDIVVKQLGAGLINMVQAKVKLEGISSDDALNSLQEEDHGILNPTLLATSSFADNDEEADTETGNPQPE